MKRLEMGLSKHFIDKAVFALTHEREPKCYIFIVLISKLITSSLLHIETPMQTNKKCTILRERKKKDVIFKCVKKHKSSILLSTEE